jgi:hypothetical protein
MEPMSPEKWTLMDNAIDGVLKKTRASPHDASAISAALESLLAVITSLARS